jgi:hypothetical protein
MPKTYEPIATYTLTSGTDTITFDNLPQTYTDLVLVANLKRSDAATGGTAWIIPWNSSLPASPQSYTTLVGDGSTVSTGRATNQDGSLVGVVPAASVGGPVFSTVIANVMNYSNATTFKTTLSRHSYATGESRATVGLTRTTAAITRLYVLTFSSATFLPGSSFTIYGIKAA